MFSPRRFALSMLAVVCILGLLPVAPARATPSIDERFRDYYDQHEGIRVLGYPQSELIEVHGYPAQYFEKGRIEDHRNEVTDPNWAFMYGRLTAELMQRAPQYAVNNTGMTYADLREAHQPRARKPAPPGFTGGTMTVSEGTWPVMFVPYDPQLRPAPGYTVPLYFWEYIANTDLFPGGWLHDIGLPMTPLLTVETIKNGERREIQMQAFERTVLTYDPRNPRDWMVERGNIGTDALRIRSDTATDSIEIPAAEATVTLPLHLLAHVGQPGDRITAALRWQDGTELIHSFEVLRDTDGRGLLIGTMGWLSPATPPDTQPATLELRDPSGHILAHQPVMVLGPGDPQTQVIDIYWLLGEQVVPHQQRIVRTAGVGAAALQALLWGPPQTQIGFTTAIPTPEEVLSFPGREPDWGARVTLRRLTIADGVATADFSQELRAYGGGSARVLAIREQITQTLLQFPTVNQVRIAIEGQTEGVLEP